MWRIRFSAVPKLAPNLSSSFSLHFLCAFPYVLNTHFKKRRRPNSQLPLAACDISQFYSFVTNTVPQNVLTLESQKMNSYVRFLANVLQQYCFVTGSMKPCVLVATVLH